MKSKGVVWWSCSALALGVLSTESALAQSPDSARSEDGVGALAEIIVTAERRPEDLQDTPVSVVAYSGAALERRSIDSIDDLQSVAPNLSLGGSNPNAGGAPDFAIRGVGQTSARPFSEKGVGLYVNDIYYPRATGSFFNLGDVQRIEVLRGPQGTLFGRNTTGGAIRYFTNPPSHEFETELSATVGTFDRRDVNALVNVPLGDRAALRVQAASLNRDGYVDVIGTDRAYGDQEDFAARATLLFEPTDDVTIKLSGAYYNNSSLNDPIIVEHVGYQMPNGQVFPIIDAFNAYFAAQNPAQPLITGPDDPRWISPSNGAAFDNCILDDLSRVAPANFGNSPTQLSPSFSPGNQCAEMKESEQVFASADIEWRVADWLTVRSLTGFIKGNDIDQGDYGLFGGSTNSIRGENESFSQEFQLTGDTERFDWVAGIYYFNETPIETHINRQLVLNPPPPAPPNPNFGLCCSGFERIIDQETRSYAVFGQGTFDITEKLGFTGGVRYTYDEKEVVVTKTGIYAPFVPPAERVQTASDEWEAVDWRATIHYDWTDDLMTYATASRGFKSGGFNGDISVLATATPGVFDYAIEPFAPEFVTSYEIGIRSEWFDNRLRANLTAFNMDFDSMVIQLADFTGGGLTLRSLNAGYVDLRGVEGEFEVAATRDLTFSASFGYIDLEYEGLNDNSPLFRPGVGTCPAAPPPPPRTFAQCGDTAQPLTRTPEWTYGVAADWSRVGLGGELSATVNYLYQDDIFSNNSTQNSIVLEGYGITNIRLGYDSLESWEIAVFGTNVFDEDYYTAGFNGRFPNSTLPVQFRSPGRPQEWGVKLTLSY